ncbi:MAG: metalloregulator ArsR/SmtB family transcription factor [Gammaproteobacteria bacterium]|nr:metalloregulator ArsR/SmtB family transcription factor [Gammaproteobacteria bacterium]
MDTLQLDLVLAAMAHPSRRRMLDLVSSMPGMSVTAVASHFDVSRIAVMKHLRILETAGLITSRKKGRVRHLFFNPIPIQLVYDRWTTQYAGFWAGRMADLKTRIEGRAGTEELKSA